MKIRILANSIRCRLTKSEVDQLKEGNNIVAKTNFGNNELFSYAIIGSDKAKCIDTSFTKGKMVIYIPNALLLGWATSNLISMTHVKKVGKDEFLNILVEKDFKCLKERSNEDESDMFPNPDEGTVHC